MMAEAQMQQVQEETKESADLTALVEKIQEDCNNCRPLTPMECQNGCRVWKIKNEIRNLWSAIDKENSFDLLLNALKNKRRLQLLGMLSENSLSLADIQGKFKHHGYNHSQLTILNEYLNPLLAVGVVASCFNRYRITMLGKKTLEILKNNEDFTKRLPPHSECYEEKIIDALFASPKTYEELKLLASTKSLGRILKRLQETGIVAKADESKYIFYFRSRRNPSMERLSSTEKKVYENIPAEGIDAEALAKKTRITLRRTYKYLRKLRGKKLAFKRKLPKKYSLTENGKRLAILFEKLRNTLMEFSKASALLNSRNSFTSKIMTPNSQLEAVAKHKKSN